MKVLYIYSGTRSDKFQGIPGKDFPDTQFYGVNHLHKFGIDAEYKEPDALVPKWLLKIPFGFRFAHLLTFFSARKYDIVFGSSLVYMLIFKKILPIQTKFVLLNFNITRTLTANKNKPLKRRLYRWLLKELDGVVCLSQFHTDYVKKQLPFLSGKTWFVPFGVDVHFYKPVFEGRANYILSVGKDNGRDYKTIVAAAKHMPKTQFQFICLPRNLEGIDCIPDNVSVNSDVPFAELTNHFQRARALLMALHKDTTSHTQGSDYPGQTVVLEAMAYGIPIIVSKQTYLTDYVRDEKEALLVDFYDPEALKEAITRLADEGVRYSLAEAARTRAETAFTTERFAERLSNIFANVADATNSDTLKK